MRTMLIRRTSPLVAFAIAVLFQVGPGVASEVPDGAALPTVIHVDDDASTGGDGSVGTPFDNLGEALAASRSITGAVAIQVAPGDYLIDSSLVMDRSDLTLSGSSVLIHDGHGWPNGVVMPPTRTRIIGTHTLGPETLLLVGRGDAVVIEDVEIRGLEFVPAEGGIGVWLRRVQRYAVHGNAFGEPAYIGVESTASSGRIEGNYFSGVVIGAAIEGGYAGSPSVVSFASNRSVRNITGGVLLSGASFGIADEGAALEVDVRDNDLSGNATSAFAFGVRLLLFGPDTSLAEAQLRAVVQGNRLVGNRIGVAVDAGFPYRVKDDVCDLRVFSGSIDLRLEDNTLRKSELTPALLTFTRGAAAVVPEALPEWQYLHGATLDIADPQGTLSDAWIDHPENDPLLGPCPDDTVNEGLDNAFRYNDSVVANGRNF